MLGKNGRFGTGGIILGQFADRIEQARAEAVVQVFRRNVCGAGRNGGMQFGRGAIGRAGWVHQVLILLVDRTPS
jgi:hypothetical protein